MQKKLRYKKSRGAMRPIRTLFLGNLLAHLLLQNYQAKFLNPALNITITIHKACHLILNSAYNKHPNLTTKNTSKTFIEFRNNYDNLRNDFYERKLTRGQFGESLWNNLVTFLENGVELK